MVHNPANSSKITAYLEPFGTCTLTALSSVRDTSRKVTMSASIQGSLALAFFLTLCTCCLAAPHAFAQRPRRGMGMSGVGSATSSESPSKSMGMGMGMGMNMGSSATSGASMAGMSKSAGGKMGMSVETNTPTDVPSVSPTAQPTQNPTDVFSSAPTVAPSDTPTDTPTDAPMDVPSAAPTDAPSGSPMPAPNCSTIVEADVKISGTVGGSNGSAGVSGIADGSEFGSAMSPLGDIDGDGVFDLVVGASFDSEDGDARGAVWVLLLNIDGTVNTSQKISDTQGSFTGQLDDFDNFGRSVANVGDLNGDGVVDIVVGAPSDDDGGNNRGAMWILFLDTAGMVISHQKISDIDGLFAGILNDDDNFGASVATFGDLDGDGVVDIAVGAPGDDSGGSARGAVWLLLLNTDGTVKAHHKISDTAGSFTGGLVDGDDFGASVASVGDLNGDGVVDIAVGAPGNGDGGSDSGAVWVLFLNADGTVLAYQKISETSGRFPGGLNGSDSFGASVSTIGDWDRDGVMDIVVGAPGDDDGVSSAGAMWGLLLNSNGTVKDFQKFSRTHGLFTGDLDDSDFFGYSVAIVGDLDGDGLSEVASGAPGDDDGAANSGAVWLLFLDCV
eukprot:m.395552 g.395552  ORF g.395552 m.395552 type:complete len:614 (+) comp21103_c0_seq1:617-2458(+)